MWGIQYSLGFWLPRTEFQILCSRNLESGFLELDYGFRKQKFFGFRNPNSLIRVDINVSKWMLHIHPGSIQGSLGLRAIHNSKEQSDLSIPEYSSRFVLCCFGITVNWSLLLRQQDLDTVIITTIFSGSICLHGWLVRVPESLPASSPFMIQASCKTTRERAAKPRERSGGFFRLWHSRHLSRAVLAWLLATPPNGELAHWLSSRRWLISVRRVSLAYLFCSWLLNFRQLTGLSFPGVDPHQVRLV